jgi:hypothetical protein
MIACRIAGNVGCHFVVPLGLEIQSPTGSTVRDSEANLAGAHGFDADGTVAAYLIRPDGHIGYRTSGPNLDR